MDTRSDRMEKPDLYVVSRFLEKLWEGGREYKQTELQMAVGLNFNVYSKYLTWLKEKGMIAVKESGDKKKTIAITEKGVTAYKTLATWIKDVIGDA